METNPWLNADGVRIALLRRRLTTQQYSVVVQLNKKSCRQSSGNPPLHEQVANPVEQWNRISACKPLLKRFELGGTSAASQGIDQGVFLRLLDQHLGRVQAVIRICPCHGITEALLSLLVRQRSPNFDFSTIS